MASATVITDVLLPKMLTVTMPEAPPSMMSVVLAALKNLSL